MLSPAPYPSADISAAESDAPQRTVRLSGYGPSRIDSARLMQGTRELLIAHAGEEYRLRLTRNGKLILTK